MVGLRGRQNRVQQKIKQSPNRGSAICGQNQAPPWLNWCRSSLELKSCVGVHNFLWYSSCSIIGISKLLSVNPNVLLFYFLDAASDWMFLPLSPISVAGGGHYQGSTAQVHRLLIATSAGTAVYVATLQMVRRARCLWHGREPRNTSGTVERSLPPYHSSSSSLLPVLDQLLLTNPSTAELPIDTPNWNRSSLSLENTFSTPYPSNFPPQWRLRIEDLLPSDRPFLSLSSVLTPSQTIFPSN